MNKEQQEIFNMVKSLYKDEQGKPIELAPGQLEIFMSIVKKKHSRVQAKCFTRYGKSLTTALGVLTRASSFPEKWAIVSGTKDKAKIIMNYINAHIFDNEYTSSKFRMEKGDSAESIRRHRNKNHITFDVGKGLIGEIFIASAKEALGHGAPNVIEDEASLIPDNEHALVMRMVGDNPHDNFMMKIGNPFFRNHFLKSDMDPDYHKINIDCYRGIDEGRFTKQQLEETKQFSYFKVLYENKFPAPETVDEQGWSYLLNEEDIKTATTRKVEPFGKKRLGVDVARGGRNYNAWVLRGDNYAKVLLKDLDNDLMSVAGKTIQFIKDERIDPTEVSVDDVGVGGGVVDRLREQGYKVNGVIENARAEKNDEFANLKAELYAGVEGVANWIKRTGYIEAHKDWEELTRIRFKKDSRGRTKMEPKEDMRKRGEESPDIADALMLTFFSSESGIYKPVNPQEILQGGAGWDM